MADTKPAELQAETIVTHHLLKYDIKSSKPNFDQLGADLLIIDQIAQKHTSFLKVQCKYRSVGNGKPNQVSVPIKYVSENFVLFLYLIGEQKNNGLYLFFPQEIAGWKVYENEYWLSLSEKTFDSLALNIFTAQKAIDIKDLLAILVAKKYTTLIIDGIFLEKAIMKTLSIYEEIWPDKVFKHPILTEVIKELLSYNRFPETEDIQCVLFLSEGFALEQWVAIPDTRIINEELSNVHLTIRKTDKIMVFQILDYLERIINVENIILVADDIAYESPLNELKDKGIDVILVKLQTDLGGNLYTGHIWGDISYPLGIALGLERHEL